MSKEMHKAAQASLANLSLKDLNLDSGAVDAVSPDAFSLCVRTLLQNWRQGTVGHKGRSDVARSNKKPWKQKGTGRARAGSARSPLWRGGGIIFGPEPRVRTLTVPRKMRQAVLRTVLHDLAAAGKVNVLSWKPTSDQPKTGHAHQALKAAGLVGERINLFLPFGDMLSYLSFSNIAGIRILYFDQANPFDLAHADRVVVLEKDVDALKEMAAQWI